MLVHERTPLNNWCFSSFKRSVYFVFQRTVEALKFLCTCVVFSSRWHQQWLPAFECTWWLSLIRWPETWLLPECYSGSAGCIYVIRCYCGLNDFSLFLRCSQDQNPTQTEGRDPILSLCGIIIIHVTKCYKAHILSPLVLRRNTSLLCKVCFIQMIELMPGKLGLLLPLHKKANFKISNITVLTTQTQTVQWFKVCLYCQVWHKGLWG